ncbi:MAG: hypothetical protein V4456_16065 [Bacteroidota bacterium]
MKTKAPAKSVFDMTPTEFKDLIRPVADEVLQETWEKNAFITYYDQNICPDTDTMIQEYKDHKELVRIDEQGNAVVIKQLSDERINKKKINHSSRSERSR